MYDIKNSLTLIILVIFGLKISAQTKIEIGEKHTIYSHTLEEEREYWVYLPKNYNDTIYAPENYPVAYFLDGERHFHSLTGVHNFLSKGPYASLPEMIFVGILNKDNYRDRDLTPTNVNKPQMGKRFNFPNSGGSEKFTNYIKNELIPEINKNYRTNDYKTLIGHSFGGLFVLNTLLTTPESFNSYIAIDPSVWWDDKYVLKKAKRVLKEKKFSKQTLYFAQAYNKPTPQDTARWHERAIVSFKEELEKNNKNDLKWTYRFFKEDDHGTVSLPSEYYGLRYIYNGYRLPVKMVANHPNIIQENFDKLSAKMNFKIKPAESRLDWIANYCLRTDRPEKAKELLLLNLKYYPNSPYALLHLGDFYKKTENLKKAKEHYKKALKLAPNLEQTIKN